MTAAGLLPGVRVLDVGQGISGPYCAKILAQMGAEVVKVEPPEGDEGRKAFLEKRPPGFTGGIGPKAPAFPELSAEERALLDETGRELCG